MDGKRSLLVQVKHFEQALERFSLPCSVITGNEQSVLINTRIQGDLPAPLQTYITLSGGLFDGKTIAVSFTTVLNEVVEPAGSTNQLAAFLNQLSLVIPLFSFQLDLETRKILIRQQFICSANYLPKFDLYTNSILMIAPKLANPIRRLTRQSFTKADARQMADFLSQNCYEVMAV